MEALLDNPPVAAPFARGDRVRLRQQPDGKLSSSYDVTVGSTYLVLNTMGCLLVTTCNELGESVSINADRFELA